MKKNPAPETETETAESVADLAPLEPAMEAQTAEPPSSPAEPNKEPPPITGAILTNRRPHHEDGGATHPAGTRLAFPVDIAEQLTATGDFKFVEFTTGDDHA